MKIAVLWANLTGYMNGSLRALAEQPGNSMFVAYQSPRSEAPFAESQFAWIEHRYRFEASPDADELSAAVHAFSPDLLLVASWNTAAYRRICREFRGKAIRVCGMDNQWRATGKQWLGIATSPIFVQRMFDAAFVAGERQAVFARKLGFREEQIWRGCYSCEHPAFHAAGVSLPADQRARAFLYVGRLAKEKAVDVLLQGYQRYREQSATPWPLWIAGTGPLSDSLGEMNGVVRHGFVQPQNLPGLFARASCFVLPSRFEPWGVVIHEATAAGLPVICTERCGAAVHLVQDGYNGYLTSANNADALATAMLRFSRLSAERRAAMSRASASLSWQFTPERWAHYVQERGEEALKKAGLLRTSAPTVTRPMHKPKVVYWNNMPSPYVVGRFNALARRGNLDFEAWFNLRREQDRSWEVDEDRWLFRARYLRQSKIGGRLLCDAGAEIREVNPDLLVSLYESASFIKGSLTAKAQGCRTAFRALPTYDTWVKRTFWKETLKQFLFRTVDGVKVPGPTGRRMVIRYGMPQYRIHQVTQTVDVAHFGSARQVTEKERLALRARLGLSGCVFAYVGRLFEGKGIRYLIEAFRNVRAAHPEASLLIIGDGVGEPGYRELASQVPGVVFSGFVLQSDLPRFYAAADVFVFPTLGDPHGVVVEEAMAAGLPVISTSWAGDIERRLPNGEAGFIVPPADSQSLANRMLALARDPVLREQFRATSLQLVQQRAHEQWAIDFESFVERTLALPARSNVCTAIASMIGHGLRATTLGHAAPCIPACHENGPALVHEFE